MTLKTGTAEVQLRREMAELLDAHGEALWALARKLSRHQQDSEDVFQETASRVWRHLASQPQIVNPRAWLTTITYRAFLDQRKKAKSCDALGDVPDSRAKAPPVEAASREEASRVQAAIENLPDGVRDLFVLHYTGGLSIRQTADAMGIAVGTAKSRLSAGLIQLRKTLQ
ncbi:MAG: RNA polymerase sigma factor [Pyrinomonadaceae bacterium]|nr:RNA polymerase sigma factor [Pirellulales bacterium]MBA3572650.1 RNA polymerase sigma factor [Pyrinomonadaceae bacterium]